jgi:DNA-binding XRE family transcriptional regulator
MSRMVAACLAGAGRVHRAARDGQPGGRTRDACTVAVERLECLPEGRDLGRAVRELRWERGLTIEALGFAAEVHPTYVAGIERGERNPSWEKVCALAMGLGATVAVLAGRAESAARVRRGVEGVLAREHAL